MPSFGLKRHSFTPFSCASDGGTRNCVVGLGTSRGARAFHVSKRTAQAVRDLDEVCVWYWPYRLPAEVTEGCSWLEMLMVATCMFAPKSCSPAHSRIPHMFLFPHTTGHPFSRLILP